MTMRSRFHTLVETRVPQDIDAKAIISAFHDHSFIITMQPIVTRHSVRDRDPASGKLTYDVWEHISLLPFGLWKREIQFTVAFTDKKDGTVSAINAPMGFDSEATYTIKPGTDWDGEGGGWVIEESIETECNVLLKWFVEGTMVPVRRKMHEQILEHVRERERKERQDEARRSEASRASGGVDRPDGNYI
ncbi:uncharacterized protein LTR77_001130 [Saxophila tyrrhenica]|uniref:DUF7053 domain-containing protein n=1 Tax=Saxophila tyrrhenica TaxID=1690608 RepID=A0AAV9PK80_9PEZI|nr:hypothetical protein LTR77_001130 [Saxophila tyrrhenica]